MGTSKRDCDVFVATTNRVEALREKTSLRKGWLCTAEAESKLADADRELALAKEKQQRLEQTASDSEPSSRPRVRWRKATLWPRS